MSTTSRVAFNTAVLMAGRVLNTIISVFTIAALTRYLGVAIFGQYTTIFAYVLTFGVLADFGIMTILVREMAKKDEDSSKIVSNILTWRTIFGLFIYLLAIFIAVFLPYPPNVKWGIAIISSAMFLLTLNSTLVGIFQAHLRMEKAVLGDLAGRLLILILILAGIKLNAGLTLLLAAYFAGNLINLLISLALSRSFIKIRPMLDWTLCRRLIREAIPMGLVFILSTIYFRIDTVILSLLKGDIDVGIYGAPYKIFDILVVVPSIFMGNVFPIITRYLHENDSRLKSAMQRSFNFLSLMAFPVSLGILFLSGPIIALVAGSDFVTTSTIEIFKVPITGILVLQVLSFSVFLFFLTNLFPPLLIAAGLQRVLIWPNTIAVLVNIVLNLLFIPHYSYLAAAVITFLTEIIILIMDIILVKKYLGFLPNLGYWLKILPAAALLAFILFWMRHLNLFLVIALGGTIYFLMTNLTGAITKQTIKEALGR
ncbi:flippase [Candidatus Berkelbacteria bacterium]|nr:flippase [Candidatus Berkelbacteria bacterium]